ncbi:MAG: crosslink repair DNA glycosylase YcaQ family protein, partial [Saprospiraceae bacterium]
MTVKEIINLRLINQQIADTKYTKPEEIVSYLGAMQSQDWAMAKWAIGLRLPGVKDADVEKAFNEGKILR